jgi:LuxR family maltose regulon positive regulatory protein
MEERVEQFFQCGGPPGRDGKIILARPQIDALLERAAQCPLVFVVAGAGYGKTQAVDSFLRKNPSAAARIRFSDRDNDEGWFWENFTQSVDLVFPEWAALLRETGFPTDKEQFELLAGRCRDYIKPGIKYIMVYDDFHLLRNKAVLAFMEGMVNIPVPYITSVIISRAEPAINTVNLFSKGLLAKISEGDLRFSPEEMDAYLEMLELRLPPGAAEALYRETEGWAFAINLAGVSIKNENGVERGQNAMRRSIFNLIGGEFFFAASGGLKKYLIKLSLIDHLFLDLMAELAGDSAVLEEMRGISSLIHFDAYSNGCQIHRLLREYLRGKQGELSPEEKRDVYLRAARWCGENQLTLEAAAYYEKAGAYDRIIDLVYTLPVSLPDNTIDFLLALFDRAPRDLFDHDASASVLYTRLLMTRGRMEEAAAAARQFIARFEGLPPSSFQARVLAGAHNNLGFIGVITSLYTGDCRFAASFEKAHEYATGGDFRLRDPAITASINAYTCRVGDAAKGGPERYIAELDAAEPHIIATLGGAFAGFADIARMELAFYRMELEDAEMFAHRALLKAQKWREYEAQNRALFYLLRLQVAMGNYEGVEEVFKLLDNILQTADYGNRHIFYDIVTGWFFAHIGESRRIAPWLKKDFEEQQFNSVVSGMETQVRIRWFMAEENYAAALDCLENHESRGLGAFLFGRVTIHILRAIGQYRTGEPERALKALETAYFLAKPNALDMPFVEMGEPLRILAGEALKAGTTGIPPAWLEMIRRNASAYGKRLTAVAARFRGGFKKTAPPGVFLSRREQAVLRGLSRGLTREEIAGDENLTLNTVKALIAGLYDKLGAINRADAIRIAAESGIIQRAGEKQPHPGAKGVPGGGSAVS